MEQSGQIRLKPANAIDPKTRAFLVLLLFLPCVLIRTGLDNDIWFILNSGRYVLQHGIPHIEPFTMHENLHFVMQQWLTAVVFWGTYSSLGAAGLIALVALVFGCTVAVTYRTARLLSGGNFVASFIATLLAAIFLSPFITTRPIIFTLLFLSLELHLLEQYIATGSGKWLIPLPFLSALVVNFQAAMWPVLFLLLLPYLIDSFRFKLLRLEGQGFPKKKLLLTVLAMLATGAINPYGFEGMTYLFRSYGYVEISQVNEMLPPNINQMLGVVIFFSFLLLGAVYFLYRRGTSKLRYLLLTLGTMVLALSSTRSYALFAVASFFPLAYYLRDLELPTRMTKPSARKPLLRVVLIVFVVLELGFFLYSRYSQLLSGEDLPECAPAVEYLKANIDAEEIVLYTGYGDGGYAEYMGFRPYLDPRAEVFVQKNNHKADILKGYFLMEVGGVYYRDVLDQYGFTHLIVSSSDILYAYLPHDKDYQKIYQDDTYAIYQKR